MAVTLLNKIFIMMMDFYFQKMTSYYESNIKDLLKKIREKDIWY